MESRFLPASPFFSLLLDGVISPSRRQTLNPGAGGASSGSASSAAISDSRTPERPAAPCHRAGSVLAAPSSGRGPGAGGASAARALDVASTPSTRRDRDRARRDHAFDATSTHQNAQVSRCVNSGSRDALVLQHDARARQHRTATLVGHQQEVCGLSWSADGATLASGGNENYLCLWDAARSGQAQPGECSPRAIMRQHQAAVKALSWCPMHRNLLASGGGTADRSIKFWNAHTGAMLHSVDTGSQVCALLWSRHHKEIVSSHGFSQNQLCLWRYPSMTKLCELTGHTARVLHLAQSPDGETVVSAAADETLRFWSIFGGGPTSAARRKGRMRDMRLSSVGGEMSIR